MIGTDDHVGITMTMPLTNMEKLYEWQRMVKLKTPFDLPEPFKGKWIVQSVDWTTGTHYPRMIKVQLVEAVYVAS